MGRLSGQESWFQIQTPRIFERKWTRGPPSEVIFRSFVCAANGCRSWTKSFAAMQLIGFPARRCRVADAWLQTPSLQCQHPSSMKSFGVWLWNSQSTVLFDPYDSAGPPIMCVYLIHGRRWRAQVHLHCQLWMDRTSMQAKIRVSREALQFRWYCRQHLLHVEHDRQDMRPCERDNHSTKYLDKVLDLCL